MTMKDACNDLKRFPLATWRMATDKGPGVQDNFPHTAS